MKTALIAIPFFLFAILIGSVSYAAGKSQDSDNISIKADSVSHKEGSDLFIASGNVFITWQGTALTSDKATYDRKTGFIHATENVIVKKGDDILTGESVTIDIQSGQGELEKGVIKVPASNLSFFGDKITKISDNEIEISATELTTCDLPDPDWKFSADQLKLNILGYAIGKGVTFYVKDIPVLYIPWIAIPVVHEKKSGILFPHFGYSNSRGFKIDIPLYLVISPSQDLLLDIDSLTKLGVGLGADYRYIRKRGSEGHFGGYLIYDLEKEKWRGEMIQSHKEIISDTLNLRSYINITTDRHFSGDYGEKSGEYNRQANDTIINALKTWDNYALSGHLRFTEDLYAIDNSHTLQKLPEISFSAVRQPFFSTPFYFDMDSTATNLYRNTGSTGQRFYAAPRATFVSAIPSYLNISAFAGLELRGYTTDKNGENNLKSRDGNITAMFGGNISTSISRIYETGAEQIKKLRHELIPELSYKYSPKRDQSNLPFYDYKDRSVQQNIIYASLTSVIDGKFQNAETSSYNEISRVRLTQGYSFAGTRRDLLSTTDTLQAWTDLMFESETWLSKNAKLMFDARYNLHENRISNASPGLQYDDKRGNSVGVSYYMAHNQVEYLEGRLSTKLLKPWTLSYTGRYSFDRNSFLESLYTVEYRQKCWSITLGFRDRPGNQSFTFSFDLTGLTTLK